ncbi:PH domain-containing protein [Salsuginibacillus kocurii]|uniref:PH domain-containing protein n=1 Tax=Salsuginibacillus kocurii TaxID=427078 RepID=UPI0003786F17|nr:PH domain-containing protein [Salsuginibacillus kocurii]
MRSEPSEKISKKALPVWRLKGAIESLFFAIVPIGYYFLYEGVGWPEWLLWVLIVGWVFLSFVQTFIIPSVRWRRWRYEVLAEEIDIQYGVFIVRRVLIPMARVQHVDTEQGPIYRRYRLAAVSISTAATIHQIPALTDEVADDLRDQIAGYAQTADADE